MCETEITPLPKTDSSVGIDLGISDFATLSTGEKISNERFLKQSSEKLAKEQKILSRRALAAKKAGHKLSESKNYQKQRVKVTKIHEKIANMRRDFLHKLSTYLVKNHDILCIEDLSSKNLMKNHKLAVGILLLSFVQIVVLTRVRNLFLLEIGLVKIVIVIMIEILTQALIFLMKVCV